MTGAPKIVNDPVGFNGQPLARYRDYLLVLTRLHLGTQLQAKCDASDIVQETILFAHDRRSQFRGGSEAEWLGWLRAILVNTIAAVAREFKTAARDLTREQSLQGELDHSSARLERLLAADQSSPSEAVSRSEELLRLASALCQLPEDQRRVVELHHLKGLPMVEIATELDRTRPAVVGLLFRGLKKLRELLIEPPEETA
ncbi:MAG: sigR 1 [Planctomycetaceae bacterium]|nr:sigR 1 [Planctomycetaceae bacterium]